MSMSVGAAEEGAPMMEINTTPLIDVMLVLIIVLTGFNERSDFEFDAEAARVVAPVSIEAASTATASGLAKGGWTHVAIGGAAADRGRAEDRVGAR